MGFLFTKNDNTIQSTLHIQQFSVLDKVTLVIMEQTKVVPRAKLSSFTSEFSGLKDGSFFYFYKEVNNYEKY